MPLTDHDLNRQLVRRLARAKVGNEAVCKWAQALTTQSGALLYFACGFICVYLNSLGRMSTSEMALVLLFAAQLQRASMEYMMTLTQVSLRSRGGVEREGEGEREGKRERGRHYEAQRQRMGSSYGTRTSE